jgi:serine/threonine-protein kinase
MCIDGRFELVRWLGDGGMGSVWAARNVHTRRLLALKFIKPRDGEISPRARRRLLREARAAAVIQHPNILAIHDVIEHEGAPTLVMDLLEGESLAQHLIRARLPLREMADILGQVASAVGAAHAAGIVHRDLKPDNIFLAFAPGEHERCDVKVLDFGLAKLTALDGDAAQSGSLTRSGDVVGTPQYMAPEQAFGDGAVDHRVDIWAFGVILYECLAGKRPFAGENLGQVLHHLARGKPALMRELGPDVPKELAAQIVRMLSLDRNARPHDLDEVQGLLRACATLGVVPRRRPPLRMVLAAALVVPLLALAVHLWSRPVATRAIVAPLSRAAIAPTLPLPTATTTTATTLTTTVTTTTTSLVAPSPPPLAAPPSVVAKPPRAHKRRRIVTDDDEARVPLFPE